MNSFRLPSTPQQGPRTPNKARQGVSASLDFNVRVGRMAEKIEQLLGDYEDKRAFEL